MPPLFNQQNPFASPLRSANYQNNIQGIKVNFAPLPVPTSLGNRAVSPQDNITPVQRTLPPNQINRSFTPTKQSTFSGLTGNQQGNVPPAAPQNTVQGITQTVAPTNTVNQPQSDQSQFSQQQSNQPQFNQSNSGLYGQIIASLANRSNQSGQDYQNAQNEANRISAQQTQLAQEYAKKVNDINGTAGFLTQATGLQGQLQNQYNIGQNALASQYQAATNRLGAANTQQGLLQQALSQAGSLAAPQLAGYNQQAFNPVTGQFDTGGGTSLNNAVSNIANKVRQGQMTYNDATNALSGYGQAGINALQQALPQGFNIAQSNTLATQQGSIKPAYNYAKTAINNLQNAVSGLSIGQNTNIPVINRIAQGFSTTFGAGSQGVQAYRGALAEARSAIQKVLASVQGGTPSDYVGQSNALLPDNATPNQIAAASQTLDTLGTAKVDIYGNPGISGTKTSTGGTLFGNFFGKR